MNDPILLRRLFRESLATFPNRRFPESTLFMHLAWVCVDSLKHPEFAAARNWNKAEGYVESRFNKDRDEDEWFLTDLGKQKEGL